MANPELPAAQRLRQRLRALLIVGSLLGPAFCVFGVLAFIADGWVRWLILSLWVVVSLLLGLLIAGGLKTLAALNELHSD